MAKLMVIVRGISGSGKSTLANETYPDAVILSTDDLWMSYGNKPKYLWTAEGIGLSHTLNKIKCKEACSRSCETVVIDNTNTTWKEIKPYIEIAKEFKYSVVILEPTNEWSKDPIRCARRNIHDVPIDVLYRQLERFEDKGSIQGKIDAVLAQ